MKILALNFYGELRPNDTKYFNFVLFDTKCYEYQSFWLKSISLRKLLVDLKSYIENDLNNYQLLNFFVQDSTIVLTNRIRELTLQLPLNFELPKPHVSKLPANVKEIIDKIDSRKIEKVFDGYQIKVDNQILKNISDDYFLKFPRSIYTYLVLQKEILHEELSQLDEYKLTISNEMNEFKTVMTSVAEFESFKNEDQVTNLNEYAKLAYIVRLITDAKDSSNDFMQIKDKIIMLHNYNRGKNMLWYTYDANSQNIDKSTIFNK